MQKALLLAAIVGPVYLVFGLSILLYVKQWQKLIAELVKNHFQMLFGMTLSLVLGLILINAYNVWEWSLYVVITITGWGALLKALFYFLAPEKCIEKVLKSPIYKSEMWLYFWGSFMTIFGVLLSYNAYIA